MPAKKGGPYYNVDWTIAEYQERYELVYAQCVDHGIEVEPWNRSWNRQTAYGKLMQAADALKQRDIAPAVSVGMVGSNSTKTPTVEEQEIIGAITAEAFTDPEASIKALAKQHHMPKSFVEGLIKRLRVDIPDMGNSVKAFKKEELVGVLESKLALVLDHLDPFAVAGASAKDLTVMAGILIDKIRLIQGEPTLIIEDRGALRDLMPLLHQEINRRGITIDGEARVISDHS